jgi:hypothetical protein
MKPDSIALRMLSRFLKLMSAAKHEPNCDSLSPAALQGRNQLA